VIKAVTRGRLELGFQARCGSSDAELDAIAERDCGGELRERSGNWHKEEGN
jgi:hypothetical protein